jgi:hypothetical protein
MYCRNPEYWYATRLKGIEQSKHVDRTIQRQFLNRADQRITVGPDFRNPGVSRAWIANINPLLQAPTSRPDSCGYLPQVSLSEPAVP